MNRVDTPFSYFFYFLRLGRFHKRVDHVDEYGFFHPLGPEEPEGLTTFALMADSESLPPRMYFSTNGTLRVSPSAAPVKSPRPGKVPGFYFHSYS